ncbi:MAG TPA: TetR/AcrR family transcriptional regulator [Bacteroidales bacterium]|nr:TetR/AcrR family transcriptional regulator [Bacteroidales bacterium]
MINDLDSILLKVRELYLKYGIKSITMDDVARELGISKKTLYQFVTDKDDLVGKFVDNEITLRKENIDVCFKIGSNAIEDLFEISLFMNKMMLDYSPASEYDLRKYYPHHYTKIVKTREEGIFNYILLNLKKGKIEGFYREEINENIIAKLYLSRFENNRFNDLFTVEEYTSIKLFKELLTYHIRGIATKKGITVLEKKQNELETNNK